MDFFSLKTIRLPTIRLLSDTVMKYLDLKRDPAQLSNFISDLLSNLQNELHDNNPEVRASAVQQLVFLNSVGYDTTWADFSVLDVMSIDNFSCKRIAYTAASQSWNPHSDVVLMATNRIQKDLNSNNPLFTTVVLSSITPFLSPQLSQDIASDIILQLNSSQAKIRQRAAVTFYHVCLKYPDTLRAGFASLKSRLNDEDNSVVFSVLTVMVELCQINPRNFIGFIPKIFKMLNNCSSDWINLRLITLLRILSTVEPRLPKKLIQPLTIVLETTPSVFVMYECVRTIIEIPISNQNLLAAATYRLQSFLNVADANLRFLCLSLFIKLMKIQPRLVSQHRDLISMCLDSDNELERMMALDLMSNLVTPKTIDTIVGKMFLYFQESNFVPFRDGMIEKVIEMCTRGGDYEMIQDFEWYISVLMDFVENGNYSPETSGSLIAQQFTELAYRVPDVRVRLVKEMGNILDKRCCTALMLSACHIIAEFSNDSEMFSKLLQPIIVECDDRVQASCLTTSFLLYIRCRNDEELDNIESLYDLKLPLFLQSQFIEIQETAASLIELVSTCKIIRKNGHFDDFKSSFVINKNVENEESEGSKNGEETEVIEIPEELNEPLTIFDDNDEELDVLYPYIRKKKHHRHHKNHHHQKSQKSQQETNIFGDDDEINEDENEIIQTESDKQSVPSKGDAFVERMIRRKQNRRKKQAQNKPEDFPVTGPISHSRFQQLGKNSAISVGAIDFIPNQKNLEIVLEIKNLSASSIPSVDFSIFENQNLHKVSAESLMSPIEGNNSSLDQKNNYSAFDSSQVPNAATSSSLPSNSSFSSAVIQHSIVISVEDTLVPQLMKFYVLPISGEALEARLKIYPSFFLIPVDPALYELASAKTSFKKSIELIVSKEKKPREILQDAVNILQANVVDSDHLNATKENNNENSTNIDEVDKKCETVDSNEMVSSCKNEIVSDDKNSNTISDDMKNDDDKENKKDNNDKSKTLISKTSTGDYVISTISYIDVGKISFEISSPIEKLTKTLIKEVELKLKSQSTK